MTFSVIRKKGWQIILYIRTKLSKNAPLLAWKSMLDKWNEYLLSVSILSQNLCSIFPSLKVFNSLRIPFHDINWFFHVATLLVLPSSVTFQETTSEKRKSGSIFFFWGYKKGVLWGWSGLIWPSEQTVRTESLKQSKILHWDAKGLWHLITS